MSTDTDETVRHGTANLFADLGYADADTHLLKAGLVRRIEPGGTSPRFEGRVRDNHHHIVCRSCGVVTDVDCAAGEAPCLTASDDHGFSIDEAEVIYWGLCPDCSTATSSWVP